MQKCILLFCFMSEIIKLQEGGSVEEQKFFNYPSGKIEQERLLTAISKNLDSYIESQNWSGKKQKRFLNSIDKFISGIKSGDITSMSEVGKFIDARGIENGGVSDETGNRRFREDKEAAYFIKQVLNAQKPYEKQEEPVEDFDINTAFAKSLNKKLFTTSSSELNPQDLYTISSLYEKNHKAFEVTFDALKSIDSKNWGLFKNKETYLKKINDLYNTLKPLVNKGKFKIRTLKSYLKTIGLNGDFYNYLSGVTDPNEPTQSKVTVQQSPEQSNTPTQQTEQQSPEQSNTPTQQTTTDYKSILFTPQVQKWWNTNSKKTYQIAGLSGSQVAYKSRLFKSGNRDGYIQNLLVKASNMNLNQLDSLALSNYQLPVWNNGTWTSSRSTYRTLYGELLDYLVKTNDKKYIRKLDDGQGYIILPSVNLNSSAVCTVYNPSKKTLFRAPAYAFINDSTVGPILQRQVSQILNRQPIANSNIQLPYQKQGGIIKAQQGTQIPTSAKQINDNNLSELLDWNLNTRYQNLYNNQTLTLQPRSNPATNNIVPTNNQYDPEEGGKQVEQQNWWNFWTQQLTTNQNLAEQWARSYLDKHSDNKIKQIYKNRWFVDNEFNFTNFKKDSQLWTDKINGIGHDVYKAKLYRLKGSDLYDTLNNWKNAGYNFDENQKPTPYNGNPLIDVYEVTKSNNNTSDKKNGSSSVTGENDKQPKSKNILSQFGNVLTEIGPSLARFWNTAFGNKKMLDEALSSLKPYYKQPKRFERYIYGDYGAVSQAEQNAQKLNTIAAKTISSDASLDQLSKLQGEKEASEQRFKGQVANANEIKRTSELALAQGKENVYNAIDTANENRYNEWNNNILRSQAQQGYIAKKTENINTLFSEMQNLYNTKKDEQKAFDIQLLSKYIEDKYNNDPKLLSYQAELTQWIKDGKSASDWPKYQDYINYVKEFNSKKWQEYLSKLSGIKGLQFNYNPSWKPATVEQQTTTEKKAKGGSIDKIYIAQIKDRLDRQKLFQKNQSEQINDTSKSIRQLSAGMSKLLSQVIKPKSK